MRHNERSAGRIRRGLRRTSYFACLLVSQSASPIPREGALCNQRRVARLAQKFRRDKPTAGASKIYSRLSLLSAWTHYTACRRSLATHRTANGCCDQYTPNSWTAHAAAPAKLGVQPGAKNKIKTGAARSAGAPAAELLGPAAARAVVARKTEQHHGDDHAPVAHEN